jgi:hypothetical protein
VALARCRSCNAGLRAEETECWACKTKVQEESVQSAFASRFAKGITIAAILSGIATIASLFLDGMPSFTKCVTSTVVLLCVKNSADQMFEKKRG